MQNDTQWGLRIKVAYGLFSLGAKCNRRKTMQMSFPCIIQPGPLDSVLYSTLSVLLLLACDAILRLLEIQDEFGKW